MYRRLKQYQVTKVAGLAVPTLISWSSDLLIIEMSIVRPPYVLDFAESVVDIRPDFPEEVWAEWRQQKAEEFGDQWPTAARVFDEFVRRWGIYHMDLSPRNVCLASD